MPKHERYQKNMYEQRTTQEQKILDLFAERKGAGVYAYELAEPSPRGLGILQYNARIYGLRHRGINVVSDHKGHFVIKEEHEKMKAEELDIKLAELRKDWLTAKPGMRKLIEMRAKLLKKQFNEDHEEDQLDRKEEYDASKAWEELQKPENA